MATDNAFCTYVTYNTSHGVPFAVRAVSCSYDDSPRPKHVHMVGGNIASLYNAPTSSSQMALGCSGRSEKYRQQSVAELSLRRLGFSPIWVPCEICDERSGTWRGSSLSASVFTCQNHSTNAPYLSSTEGQKLKPRSAPKSNALSENWKHWT